MCANPREHAPRCPSQKEREAWARHDAKSEAMVRDVLERTGATNPATSTGSGVPRGLETTAAALLIAAIVGGSLWFALDQTRWDADPKGGVATDGDRSPTTAFGELSRFDHFRP